MRQSFLDEVADSIIAEHGSHLERIAIVFNNKRPIVHLRKKLGERMQQPFFLPQMIGMNDFVAQICHLEILPSEYLLFELFDIHQKLDTTHKDEPFDRFISFGEIMLSDFSEIDLYRVDAEQLFCNLSDIKEIGEWHVDGSDLTPLQKDYLNFFKQLYTYYTLLHERLQKKGKAFSGMAYRIASEQAERAAETLPYDYVYFVGFNALSESEIKIMKSFISSNRGKLITDGDEYYYKDPQQESGLFLRRYTDSLHLPTSYANHFANGEKKINIVSCPENIIQTKYAAQRLAELMDNIADEKEREDLINDTAVVLADENLLVPMLNALPESVGSVNVTIGYPYVYSATHSLASKLLDLYINNSGGRFYHADITPIVCDTLLQTITKDHRTPSQIDKRLNDGTEKLIYANKEQLVDKKIIDKKIGFIFAEKSPNVNDILDIWSKCIELLKESLKNNPREYSALSEWQTITQYFKELHDEYPYFDCDVASFSRIYSKFAKRCNLSLRGEPLKGLQLLGMLEARNLDFKNIILLSANEGTLPKGRSENTLIPFNLKKAYGLPTYTEKDAVFANHFYSLIQRAENIDLVYNTETDGSGKGKGEPSRFVMQVRDELSSKYKNITIKQSVIKIQNANPNLKHAAIGEKNKTVIDKLKKYLSEKGLSASALNTYRTCQLSFYYRYVLGIQEVYEFDEDMDSAGIGTCVHKILEETYKPTIGRYVTKEELDAAIIGCNDNIKKYFDTEIGSSSTIGRNHLAAKIAAKEITDFLSYEKEKKSPICILGTEQQVETIVEVDDPARTGEKITVKCTGNIDRVERYDDKLLIADYKTGKVEEKDLKLKDKDDKQKDTKISDKWMQLMFYAWLYKRNNPGCGEILSGIYPLRSNKKKLLTAEWNGNSTISTDTLDNFFNKILQPYLSELLDPETPFSPAKFDATAFGPCNYCPMQSLCQLSSSNSTTTQNGDAE